MAAFKGMVRLVGDSTSLPASVEVTDRDLSILAAGTELGRWQVSELAVEERPAGFLVSVEGEQLFLSVLDRSAFLRSLADARQAVAAAERRGRRRLGRRRRSETEAPATPRAATAPSRTARGSRRRRQVEVPVPEEPVVPVPGPSAVSVPAPSAVLAVPEPEPVAEPHPNGRRLRIPGLRRPARPETPDTAAAHVVAASPDETADEEESRTGRIADLLAGTSVRQRIVAGTAVTVIVLAVFAPNVLALITVVIGGVLILAGTLAYLDPYTAVRVPAPWTALRLMAAGGGFVVVALVIPLLRI